MERAILIAVARADLALCGAWSLLRAALPGLLIGAGLWRIIKLEEGRR